MSIKPAATLTLLALGALAADLDLERTVNFAYGNSNDVDGVPYNQSFILEQFAMIKPPASAIQPFIINQPDISPYTNLINAFNQSGTYIYPAFGDGTGLFFSPANKDIARAYRTFTDRVQLTGVQSYADGTGGIQDIYSVIEFCIKIGFNHIQLNPWPMDSNRQLYPMPYYQVDSAVEEVQLNLPNGQSPPFIIDTNGASNVTNWTPNANKIHAILAYNSSVEVLINYENRPEEAALATLHHPMQIEAFETTINNITGSFPGGRVHWTPPWSVNYDPISNNTWDFIVAQLNGGNSP